MLQYTVCWRLKGLSCHYSFETYTHEEWAIRKAKPLQEDYQVLIFESIGWSPVAIRKWVANRA